MVGPSHLLADLERALDGANCWCGDDHPHDRLTTAHWHRFLATRAPSHFGSPVRGEITTVSNERPTRRGL